MKKFSIEYHETYGKTYEIEANSPEEAEEILRDMICNGEENAPEECENSWCDNVHEIVEVIDMNKCPWCGNKAIVRKSPLGYYCACSVNGHAHNIGCFGIEYSVFSKTENEAKELWNKETSKIR